jgi:predicted neutral ceramidase superfamily lipid hydrolase
MKQKAKFSKRKNNDRDALKNKPTSTAVESSMKKTTSVTSYVFGAPKPYKTGIAVIIFSLIAGFLINFDLNNIAQNFSGQRVYSNAIIFGLFLIGLPALLSALISTPLAHLLGGTFYYRRSFLLAFFSSVVLVIVMFLGKFLNVFLTFDFLIIIIFGYAMILSIRHSVLLATSNHKNLNSLPAAINQTVFGFLFICVLPGLPYTCSNQAILYMIAFTIIFLITTFSWIWIVKRPFKRNFNMDGLLLMKQSLSQFTEDVDSGRVLETEFFSKLGQSSNLRLGVVGIKNKKGNPTNQLDTLMVSKACTSSFKDHKKFNGIPWPSHPRSKPSNVIRV